MVISLLYFQTILEFQKKKRKMIITKEPQKKKKRVSITQKIIKNSVNTVVLVPGAKKGKMLGKMKYDKMIPGNFILDGKWLLNKSAYNAFRKY